MGLWELRDTLLRADDEHPGAAAWENIEGGRPGYVTESMSATISTTASPHKAHKIHASLRCSRFTTPFTAFWERSSTVPRSDDELVKTAAPHEGDSVYDLETTYSKVIDP
ncbi:hypothetical protein TWF594_002670 [Orbilia oligospora]|nr:hypothetical protein TWF594_002670 [Orbilia oligospora]